MVRRLAAISEDEGQICIRFMEITDDTFGMKVLETRILQHSFDQWRRAQNMQRNWVELGIRP